MAYLFFHKNEALKSESVNKLRNEKKNFYNFIFKGASNINSNMYIKYINKLNQKQFSYLCMI